MKKFKTVEELLEFTQDIKGRTFRELDVSGRLNEKNKGDLGQIVEEGFYGYPPNSNAKADFDEIGVELKVSGFVRNKNGTVSAKERISLSSINFNTIVEEEFDFSSLIFKNKKLLIIWYEYENGKNKGDFQIQDFQLYDMDEQGDIEIIRNDFEIIKRKVLDGKAHELSDSLTTLLAATTKGANRFDLTDQPYSVQKAMRRAYTLKNGYMTGILRQIGFASEPSRPEYNTVEEYVLAKMSDFIGWTQMAIYEEVSGKTYEEKVPKQLNKMISDLVIGKDKELRENHPLFIKTHNEIKNISVNEELYPLERMSFRNLALDEFEDTWQESAWKMYFEEVTFIVMLYQGPVKSRNGERILHDIKAITFNYSDIELFGRTYDKVKEAIDTKDISKLPYPKTFDGQILEVAPKGQKGDNAYNNFFEKDVTKVCFMLDKDFLFRKLKE